MYEQLSAQHEDAIKRIVVQMGLNRKLAEEKTISPEAPFRRMVRRWRKINKPPERLTDQKVLDGALTFTRLRMLDSFAGNINEKKHFLLAFEQYAQFMSA